MPETTALMSRSKEKIITQPHSPACACETSPHLAITPLPPQGRGHFARACLSRGADLIGYGERPIGAVDVFDGHEDHLLVAEIFQVMDLVLARPIGLVAGLAGPVGIFDGGTVVDVLAAAPARDRGPEIVEHMAVEADPLARRQPDDPDPDLFVLRKPRGAEAAVIIRFLALAL